jgi:predicted Zn-dependent peptidase
MVADAAHAPRVEKNQTPCYADAMLRSRSDRRLGAGRIGLSLGVLALLACRPAPTTQPTAPAAPAPAPPTVEEIFAASELPPTVESPLPEDAMAATVHRLQNGMTVYVSTDRQKPRFTAWIVVRSGSRNDPADSTGLAHYLEHMLFKGTDDYGTLDIEKERPHLERIEQLYAELRETDDEARRAEIFGEIDRETQASAEYAIPNEIDRMYASLGIEGVNAFTSDEVTAYTSDVPANRLEAWAKIEAERFSDPVFRLFYPELEAVYEEKNLSIDNPDRRVQQALMRGLFPRHPYGTQPTIGLVDHLKSPAYQDMVQYFEDWYAPNNMAVVLAGDIDAATALPVLEKTLGTLKPSPLAERRPAELPAPSGRVHEEILAEGEETVSIAWKTVDVDSTDEPVMRVLDWLMDNSRSGLLNTELELTQLVPEAGSWADHEVDAGHFGIQARLKEGQTHAEVEKLLLGVVAKLKAGDFSDADVEAIKLHEDIREKQQLESNWGRVARMMDSFVSRRSWARMMERDQKLRAVKKADVMRVANEHLGDDFVVVYRKNGKQELPKIEKPSITPVDIDPGRESPFARDIAAMEAAQLEPQWLVEGAHYHHRDLAAGRMIAAVNERNDLFSLDYVFERGYRKTPMVCVALELLERSGAGDTPADELQRRLYRLGTDVSFDCSADESSIRIRGIDQNLEQSIALVDGWLRAPTFSAEDLEKLAENTISTRRDELDDSNMLGWALGDYAKYGKDSPWLARPSNSKVQKASGKRLKKLLTTFPDYRHRTLYFGPRSAEEAAEVIGLGKKHRKVGARKPRRYRTQKGAKIYFLHKDVAKSDVSIAMPNGPQPREKKPLARFLGQYLGGGMSGLIFQEIREARGLAYYAFGYVSQGQRPGDDWGFVGGVGTQSDKTAEAIGTFLELVRERPIDETRLGHARESLEQEFRSSRIDPRWIVRWVKGWDDQGENEDPRPWEWKTIQGLQAADVQAFAKAYADRPIIISIVGDRTRVDMKALEKIAPVVEVEPDDLVAYGPFPKE